MKTSFNVPRSLVELETEILNKMDIPRVVLHRRMIRYYFDHDIKISPRILARGGVKKDGNIQIYLSDDEKALLDREVARTGCKIGQILLQAAISYYAVVAQSLIKEGLLDDIF